MSSLSIREKIILEELLEMRTGYVLDFSNASFSDFVEDTIGLKIYSDPGYEEYASKANKLRQIWENEPDALVGKLMNEMLDYCEDYYLKNNNLNEYKSKKLSELKERCKKFQNELMKPIELPYVAGEFSATIAKDINRNLVEGNPELALDRLHTYAESFIRGVCEKHHIKTIDNKGHKLALHSLIGAITKEYEKEGLVESRFSIHAMKSSISLFDGFDNVRNDSSYAHVNEILQFQEASYVIRMVTETLRFINEIENSL